MWPPLDQPTALLVTNTMLGFGRPFGHQLADKLVGERAGHDGHP